MNMRTVAIAARVLTLVAAMFAASTLSAQSDGTELLNDVRARESIQQVIRSTQSKNISIEPLLRKVHEGVSKQSDPALIQAAIKVLAKRLELSSAALAPTYSVDELSAGASALQIGVPAPTLRELRKLWPNKPLTVPLAILYELVALPMPVAKATKRVRELMERGASSSQLVALAATVEADVAAGLSADAALELRTKGIMSLLPTPVGTATIIPNKPRIRPK